MESAGRAYPIPSLCIVCQDEQDRRRRNRRAAVVGQGRALPCESDLNREQLR